MSLKGGLQRAGLVRAQPDLDDAAGADDGRHAGVGGADDGPGSFQRAHAGDLQVLGQGMGVAEPTEVGEIGQYGGAARVRALALAVAGAFHLREQFFAEDVLIADVEADALAPDCQQGLLGGASGLVAERDAHERHEPVKALGDEFAEGHQVALVVVIADRRVLGVGRERIGQGVGGEDFHAVADLPDGQRGWCLRSGLGGSAVMCVGGGAREAAGGCTRPGVLVDLDKARQAQGHGAVGAGQEAVQASLKRGLGGFPARGPGGLGQQHQVGGVGLDHVQVLLARQGGRAGVELHLLRDVALQQAHRDRLAGGVAPLLGAQRAAQHHHAQGSQQTGQCGGRA